MCGITGILTLGIKDDQSISRMNACLSHRGPDANGFFREHNYQTGHNRLSIIDLSDKASQPMTSNCGRFVLTYNGEVYNYKELSLELKAKGISLRSNSDTEVILEGISLAGWEFVNRLNGMFAFCIYDRKENKLNLFRDRVGIKPLFLYQDSSRIAYASEIKALESIENADLSIDFRSIVDFLHLGFIPAPNTIYNKINKILPGEHVSIDATGNILRRQFHRLGQNFNDSTYNNENEASSRLDELITHSVNLQLRSDVPCGVFLSGGIDSSLIALKAANASKNKIDTFTIGNKETIADESKYAKKVADAIGTNHHELIIGEEDIIGLVEDSIDTYDEPLADASIIPTLLVSKLAKSHVKVVLSGEGGDELFMGYGSHRWAKRLNNPITKIIKQAAIPIMKKLPSRYVRISDLLSLEKTNGFHNHIFSQEQYFFTTTEVINILMPSTGINLPNSNLRFDRRWQEELYFASTGRNLSYSERQAFFDLEYYLSDDLLTKIDRATMLHSIEARVPFLDNELIEFALNINSKLKIKGSNSKYLLKKVLFSHLDSKLFNRPKSGFSLPLIKWLKSDLQYLVEKYLSNETIIKVNLVNPHYVRSLINQYNSGMHHLYNRIWALVVLHRWMYKRL